MRRKRSNFVRIFSVSRKGIGVEKEILYFVQNDRKPDRNDNQPLTNTMEIVIDKGISPKECDIAFAPIDVKGNLGNLNTYVWRALKYTIDPSNFRKDLEMGGGMIQQDDLTPIILVVTIDYSQTTLDNLVRNLRRAFRLNWKSFQGKSIWLPLMGIGTGGLRNEESFHETMNALVGISPEMRPSKVVVSLPNELSGSMAEIFRNQVESYFGGSLNWKPVPQDFVKTITDAKRTIYAVGAYWAGWGSESDRTDKFIKGGYWENGDETKAHIVAGVNIGDIFVLKSTFPRKNIGFFRIKAVGVVLGRQEGRVLVSWLYPANNLDVPGGLNKLRARIGKMSENDFIEMLGYFNFSHLQESGLIDAILGKGPIKKGAGSGFSDGFSDDFFKQRDIIEQRLTGKDVLGFQTTEDPVTSTGGGTTQEPIIDYVHSEAISTDHGDQDSLNFDKDAQALAALIALKDMRPPLAIALFGRWGSGKSFFMNRLEKRIRELSKYQGFLRESVEQVENDEAPKKGNELFLPGIAHIKFNAWSYLDANLWAGLAHSMFEKLNLYINDHTKGDVERLKVQVKITKRLDILHSELNDYKAKRDQLEKLKKELEEEKKNKILSVFSKKYDQKLIEFFEKHGFEEGEIRLMTPSRLRKVIKGGMNFFSYLKSNAYSVTVGIVSVILLVMICHGLVSQLMKSTEWNRVHDLISSTWAYFTTAVIPVFIPFAKWLVKKKNVLGSVDKLVEELNTIKKLTNEKDPRYTLTKDLGTIDELIDEVETSIQKEYSKTSDLTQLAIANFISEKSDQEDYKKHLGIITTIRKDFETLSDLFIDLDRERDETLSDGEKARAKEEDVDRQEIHDAFKQKLDRIVLYIDDLDRCSDEKVLEVLQAVHLLMAFPLFIVVVGVDERSVHNALSFERVNRYKGISKEAIEENRIQPFDPREYLEKIFQIPFQLPMADADAVKTLIDHIVQDEEPEKDSKTDDDEQKEDQEVIEQSTGDSDDDFEEPEPEDDFEEQEPENLETSKKTDDDVINPVKVSVTKFEKDYLKKLSVIVGRNPRTIKRFVNIFRVVKTHENQGIKTEEDAVRVILLIAFLIGENREIGVEMFLDERTSEVTIEEFLKSKNAHLKEQLDKLSKSDPLLSGLLGKKSSEFNKHLKFVERFSYKIGWEVTEKQREKEGASEK